MAVWRWGKGAVRPYIRPCVTTTCCIVTGWRLYVTRGQKRKKNKGKENMSHLAKFTHIYSDPTFYWISGHQLPKLKGEDAILVAICRFTKYAHFLPLQPLPIPTQAWQHITMDFVEQLPKSNGEDAILVVICRFTKYAYFLSLQHLFSAKTVAKLFLESITKLHGVPQSIVSDKDKIFTSLFWKNLFKMLGTKLAFSTAYHPQSDGQTQRLNQSLEGYLRCFYFQQPHFWSKWLSLAEWWYNTSHHSAI